MNKNITVREYKEGDEVSILKLRALVLSDSKDMNWWVWQHKLNPCGQAVITVAEDEEAEEIVGHMCGLPARMKIEDDIHYVVSTVDTMVHPSYRGLGIYSQLRRKSLKTAKEKQYMFTYSFPNLDMRPINQKHRVRPIFKKTPLWIKPLQVESTLIRYLNNNRILINLGKVVGRGIIRMIDKSRNYQVQTDVGEVNTIDKRFDSLWEKASPLHKIMMVRDKAYLDWRYIKRPDADYTIYVSKRDGQLLGYIVLRSIEDNSLKVGWITDILTHSKDTLATMDLIDKAIQHFELVGADIVMCVMPPKAYIAPILRRHGYILASKWRSSEFNINSTVLIPKYPDSFLFNPSNWYLTRGDSDLI